MLTHILESLVKKKNDVPVVLLIPGPDDLEGFKEAINYEGSWVPGRGRDSVKGVAKDYRPVHRELRRLLTAWRDSGPNISKLAIAEPFLTRRFAAQLIPNPSRFAQMAYFTAPGDIEQAEPVAIAQGLFMNFLLNQDNERLGGPCRHCDKYYVMKTKRQDVYCSKQCGQKHTSQAAIRKYRRVQHAKKLEKANRYAARWAKTKTSKDWKDWINRETLISKNFLTRAVRNGELLEPAKQI